MLCECRCGTEFEPRRRNQIYFNAAHRQADKNRRWPRIRRADLRESFRSGLGERQEAQTSGGTPLPGGEIAESAEQEKMRQILKIGPEVGGERKTFVTFGELELIDPAGAAALLAVRRRTLEYWRRKQVGPPFYRLGSSTVRYSVRQLSQWAESRRCSPGE